VFQHFLKARFRRLPFPFFKEIKRRVEQVDKGFLFRCCGA
jgi:hypothetical protein